MFKKQSIDIQGTVAKGFEGVQEAFQENFNNGDELSAQVCVVKKGEIVSEHYHITKAPTSRLMYRLLICGPPATLRPTLETLSRPYGAQPRTSQLWPLQCWLTGL